jgi:hypothetical protein
MEVRTIVGVAATRDAAPERDRADPPSLAVADAIRSEIDRALLAWYAPVIETRTRIERGQGEAWLLLASPCGTLAETTADAGAGAILATAAFEQALSAAGSADVEVEPFVAVDGMGLLAHGAARAGESPEAHARRLADVAARAFAADAILPASVAQARSALLMRAAGTEARALAALAAALAPAHPSWFDALGPASVAAAGDEAVASKAAAVRAGPLRMAVLANVDGVQASAASRAVDRWIARSPGEARACAPVTAPLPPRPGTYAVELTPGAAPEVWLAAALAPDDPSVLAAATWTAAALDGPAGLLARALGAVPGALAAAPPPLARAWSATVMGGPKAPARVVRLQGPDATLDAAVAQTRALLERLRQGALDENERGRAAAVLARAHAMAELDPRARILALWRGQGAPLEPSLEALHAFAAAALRDDTLVLVAARPYHPEPRPRGAGGKARP